MYVGSASPAIETRRFHPLLRNFAALAIGFPAVSQDRSLIVGFGVWAIAAELLITRIKIVFFNNGIISDLPRQAFFD